MVLKFCEEVEIDMKMEMKGHTPEVIIFWGRGETVGKYTDLQL